MLEIIFIAVRLITQWSVTYTQQNFPVKVLSEQFKNCRGIWKEESPESRISLSYTHTNRSNCYICNHYKNFANNLTRRTDPIYEMRVHTALSTHIIKFNLTWIFAKIVRIKGNHCVTFAACYLCVEAASVHPRWYYYRHISTVGMWDKEHSMMGVDVQLCGMPYLHWNNLLIVILFLFLKGKYACTY